MRIIFDTSIIPVILFFAAGMIFKIISEYREKKHQEDIRMFNSLFPPMDDDDLKPED